MSIEERAMSINEPEAVAYEPVSRLALLALLISAFAWLALVHPVLVFVPLLSVIVAMVALWIGREPVGRTVALVAVFVAVLCAVWGPSRHFSRQYLIFRSGRQHADEWLRILQEGRLLEAHQLGVSMFRRQRPDSLNEYYTPGDFEQVKGRYADENEMPYVQLRNFYRQEPFPEILASTGDYAEGFDFRFLRNLSIKQRSSDECEVHLLYLITPRSGDMSKAVEMTISLSRDLAVISKNVFWRIVDVGPTDGRPSLADEPPPVLRETLESASHTESLTRAVSTPGSS